MESMEFCVILVTAPDEAVARTIGRALVESSLAACVTLMPGVTSIYSWDEQVHEDREVQLIIKAVSANFDSIASKIKSLHPYEVPEIIMVPVMGGSASYLAWIDEVAGHHHPHRE